MRAITRWRLTRRLDLFAYSKRDAVLLLSCCVTVIPSRIDLIVRVPQSLRCVVEISQLWHTASLWSMFAQALSVLSKPWHAHDVSSFGAALVGGSSHSYIG